MMILKKIVLAVLLITIAIGIVGQQVSANEQLDHIDFSVPSRGYITHTPYGVSAYLGGCTGPHTPPVCVPIPVLAKYNLSPSHWEWNFGDGQPVGFQPYDGTVHYYSNPGLYTVRLLWDTPWIGADPPLPDEHHDIIKNNYVTILPQQIIAPPPTPQPTPIPTPSYPAPAASFKINQQTGNPPSIEGTTPFTVQFTDTSSGNIVARKWDFGDGTKSEEKNPTHTFSSQSGHSYSFYEVKLTVNDHNGRSSISNGYVGVIKEIHPNFSIDSDPPSGMAPLMVTFTDTSKDVPTDILGYRWDFGDGADPVYWNPDEGPLPKTITHEYTSDGSYIATLSIEVRN